jgi:hypothetical protein
MNPMELRSNIERIAQGKSEAICHAVREVRYAYLSFFPSNLFGSMKLAFSTAKNIVLLLPLLIHA